MRKRGRSHEAEAQGLVDRHLMDKDPALTEVLGKDGQRQLQTLYG